MARTRITARAAREALDDLVTALDIRHRLLLVGYWGAELRNAVEYWAAVRWRQAAEVALAGTERGRTRTVVECVAMGFKNLGEVKKADTLWEVLYDES